MPLSTRSRHHCPADDPQAIDTAHVLKPQHPSSTSSTSTASSSPSLCTMPQTDSLNVNLKSLPADVFNRIIAALTHDAHRSCPYYPPKLLENLLPLSQTCRHFHAAITPYLTSDLAWLDSPDLHADALSPTTNTFILDWYRAAANLTHLHLHAQASRFPNLRLRVMNNLISHPPPLRHIDLVGILDATSFEQCARESSLYDSDSYDGDDLDDEDDDHHSCTLGNHLRPDFHPILTAVSNLLAHVRDFLTSIRVEPLPPVIDALAVNKPRALQHLHLHLAASGDTSEQIERLIHAVNARTVTTLTLMCKAPFPTTLSATRLASLLPNVSTFDFRDGVNASTLQPRPSYITELPLAFPSLTQLTFHNVQFGHVDDQCADLWRLDFRHLEMSLVAGCKFVLFPEVLPDFAARSVRRLELCSPLDGRQVDLLALKCVCVHTLAITVLREGVHRLPNALAAWSELQSLHLSIPPAQRGELESRELLEGHLVNAFARNAGAHFHKLVLHGETLCVRNVSCIVRSLGGRLEYLVTGLYTPFASRSRSIMRLLHVIRRHCENIRVLCFGLALVYDRRALQLDGVFLRDIEKTGECLRFLDTSWLKKNASNLKKMTKPVDFVDYDSRDEGPWGF